jgi:hypothetical protein
MVDNVTGICESKYNFNISTFIDHAIVRSMFMLSFIFVIVCDLFEWMQIYIKVFCHLFTYVLALEIQLLRREGWDSINWFNPTVLLYLSQV